MVILFESNVVSPPVKLYMGLDKHENEQLIRWGWPEDVWFHVDKLSSAHVYLRMQPGQSLDDIPSQVIDDCAQLVKANSIQGNKMNNIDVVYTPWENLHKSGDMVVGQVGFKSNKQVQKVHVEKRLNEVVNRLNKTKKEMDIDYRSEREERDKLEREDTKAKMRQQRQMEAEQSRLSEEQRKAHSYDIYMTEDNMRSNLEQRGNDSDDFM